MMLIPEDIKNYRKIVESHLDLTKINYILDAKELFDVFTELPHFNSISFTFSGFQLQKFYESSNSHFSYCLDVITVGGFYNDPEGRFYKHPLLYYNQWIVHDRIHDFLLLIHEPTRYTIFWNIH